MLEAITEALSLQTTFTKSFCWCKVLFYVEQLPGFNRGTVVNFVIECSKHREFCGWPHCSTAPQTAKMRFVTHVARPQASSDKSKSKI